jgi:hypothetical protein
MFIGFSVLSDLITTFYLSKTFHHMKIMSERSVDFLMRTLLLLTALVHIVLQSGPNS